LLYIVQQYTRGSRNALAAGFDGVEVHAANGYLLDQFINSRSNHRADSYGGAIENRARLLIEVVEVSGFTVVGHCNSLASPRNA
jgi:N-ethylmaleimide reductase